MPTWTAGADNATTWTWWVTNGTVTALSQNDVTWHSWTITSNNATTSTATFSPGRSLGAEELAALHERQRQAEAEAEQRREQERVERASDPLGLSRLQRERERDQARGRALAILCEQLTHAQIEELMLRDHFHVHSQQGRRYRIDLGYARNVREVDADGHVVSTYCAHPSNAAEIPNCDSMLIQKLMLEIDEACFLATANRTRGLVAAMVA